MPAKKTFPTHKKTIGFVPVAPRVVSDSDPLSPKTFPGGGKPFLAGGPGLSLGLGTFAEFSHLFRSRIERDGQFPLAGIFGKPSQNVQGFFFGSIGSVLGDRTSIVVGIAVDDPSIVGLPRNVFRERLSARRDPPRLSDGCSFWVVSDPRPEKRVKCARGGIVVVVVAVTTAVGPDEPMHVDLPPHHTDNPGGRPGGHRSEAHITCIVS